MKKQIISGLVGLGLVVSFGTVGAYNFEVPDNITMEECKEVEAPIYSPVEFPHSTHDNIECSNCHHTWNEEGKPKKCVECHELVDAEGKEKKDVESMYYVYHDRSSEITCVGCHQELKKKGENTGPLSCNKCHE